MNTKAENYHKESEQVNKERIKYNKKQQQQKCISKPTRMAGMTEYIKKRVSSAARTRCDDTTIYTIHNKQ